MKQKILVVENENTTAQNIKDMLENLGYDVPAISSSGEDAILKSQNLHPDLILMDIMLDGDIDGIEAADRIREKLHIPVVYLTAYDDDSILKRAKITEPFGYMLKPFQEKELRVAIETALYKHSMERKIEENERWLYTTLRSIGDAVIATDKNGYIKFMNHIAESLTGWSQDESAGIQLGEVFKIVDEKTKEPIEGPVIKVIRSGQVVGFESHTILISRDGKNIPIDDSAAPILDNNGSLIGIVLAFRDVSERRKTETALVESERKYRILAENVIDVIWSMDMNMNLTYVSPSVTQLSGFSVEEVMNQKLEESLTPVSFQVALDIFNEEIYKEEAEDKNLRRSRIIELEEYCRDGSTIWTENTVTFLRDDQMRPIGILGVTRDISERKRTEELIISQRNLALVLNNIKELDEALDLCLDTSIQISGMDCGGIYLFDDLSGSLDLMVNVGVSDEFVESASHVDSDSPIARMTMEGIPIYKRRQEFGVDIENSIAYEGLRALALIPIQYEGNVSGCLNVASHTIEAIPQYSQYALESIASQIGGIIARLKAEKSLHESKERYHSLFDGVPVGLYRTTPDGQILDSNSALVSMLGYPDLRSFLRTNMKNQHVNIDDRMRFLALLEQEDIVKDFETQLRRYDGTIIWVKINGRAVRNKLGQVLYYDGSIEDITDRKRAEDALKQRNSLLATINALAIELASLPSNENIYEFLTKKLKEITGAYAIAFSIYDPNSQTLRTSHLELESGTLEKVTRLLGKRFKDIHSPVSKEMYNEIVSQVIGKRKTLTEVSFGAIPPLVSTAIQKIANIDRFIGIAYVIEGELYGMSMLAFKADIPDPSDELLQSFGHMVAVSLRRRRVEEALKSSEDRLATFMNSASDSFYLFDSDLNVIEINRKALDIIGKSRENVIGSNIMEILPDVGKSGRYEKHLEVMRTGEPFIANDFITHPVFGNMYFILKSFKVGDGLGVITSDITEQKQSEGELQNSNRLLGEALAELKSTQQQIIQQERLRALGQLASGIAHDFNNSLTPILGYSELLMSTPDILDEKERASRYIKLINTASGDAKNVVERLREFYRNREDNERITRVNINEIINQAIQLTQPRWKGQAQAKGVMISMSTELLEIPVVNANESELREVLVNLIFNAVDAINQNGSICLSTRCDGNSVVLEVTDTGIGMSEDVKRRCFEPFFTTKEGVGTGLGLSIVHGIIRRHKGTIEIESEAGKGTRFTIYLPMSESEYVEIKEKKEEPPLKQLNVLVVDDEPLVREVLGEYLKYDGHTFNMASNGQEALDRFTSGKYDVIILDRAMPQISGDLLANLIKQEDPTVPIIMITGFGSLMKDFGEMPDNVDYLMSKPVKLNDLHDILAKAFR